MKTPARILLLAAVLVVGSCVGGEDPTGVRVAEVTLALQPALIPSAADGSALPIDRIRAVVLRQPDDVLLQDQRFDVLSTAFGWTIARKCGTSERRMSSDGRRRLPTQ